MNWRDKYENFSEFEKSPDYKKWLEEKLQDAPIIKTVKREKTQIEKAIEQRDKEIQEAYEQLEEITENNPANLVQIQNEESGEIEYMTRKEWEEEQSKYNDC